MTPEVAISAQAEGRASSNTKPPDRPIRLLHVIEGLGTGGAEQQLTAFILRSDQSRFQHAVCTLAQVGHHANVLRQAGVPIYPLRLPDQGVLLRCVVSLARVMRAVDPDIIHASLYRPSVASRVAGRLFRKIVVNSLVNSPYEPEWMRDSPRLRPSKVAVVKAIDAITARALGTAFVAITQSVKESAIRRLGLPPQKIAVIPRGLLFDMWAEPAQETIIRHREMLGVREAYPVVVNVGRLVPQKGQRFAILAMRRICSRFPGAHLLIAGDGPLRAELECLVRSEGLEGCVTLLGDRRDVGPLLWASDIFVFPSLSEGLGNAVLEAMAAARSCVVSRIPALLEVTDNGRVAILSEPQSPQRLAEAVIRLAEDRADARKMGELARAWVRKRFDFMDSVRALELFYASLAKDRSYGVRGVH